MENDNGNGLHIVMFPFLAFGHISPFIQLSGKLAAVDPTARITFLSTPANVPRIASLLPSSSSITIHSLPLPPVPGLPPGAESTADLTMAQAELLKTAVDTMKPDVGALLSRIRPHFIFFDFAMPWIPSIATPLGIKSLFFTVFAAIANAYVTVPSRRRPLGSPPPTIEDFKKPPPGFPATSAIAGGIPTYQAKDIIYYVFKTFGDGKPCVYDRVTSCINGCSAIIFKTCKEMEGQYINYSKSEYKKPMLFAGPVMPEPPSGELEEKWGKWLDKFEQGSVIYCSFGSETFLKDKAIKELLLGLEMTELPFFVVLNYLEGEDEMRKKLPEGLEDRVRHRGVIHLGWVQQQLILCHKSVGCYVNHVGFSSVVEGLVAECQLVMLPQRGDQYLNSALFAGDLGIGVEVRREETTGDFAREAVCEAVKKVMVQDGEEREKIMKYQKKWREFLMDKGVEERFMMELVQGLKTLAD